MDSPDSAADISIDAFNTVFQRGFELETNEFDDATAANMDTSKFMVQRFRGKRALAINSVTPLGGFLSENIHPGGADLDADEDPTLRAVLLGTYVGKGSLII